MSLGLKRGIVQLEPHDKQWDEIALQTIKTLKSILGDDAIDIQHIGSTAIPAIKSKPIIDIAVVYRKVRPPDPHNLARSHAASS